MGINSMGSGSSNKIFFNIYSGKLVIEYGKREELEKRLESLGLDPEKIKTRKRTKGKNEGKDVFYYNFNDVSGNLTRVSIGDRDYGEYVELEFDDVGQVFVVNLGDVFGRYVKDFVRRCEGLDLNKEVAFGTWSSEADNGKNYSGVRMYQDGNKLEYVYQREDLPPATSKKRGSKTEWDFRDQESFLYDILEKFIAANFKPKGDAPKDELVGTKKGSSKKKKTSEKAESTGDLPWEK